MDRTKRSKWAVSLASILVLAGSGCQDALSEEDLIQRVAQAMGGAEAVRGATTLVLEGSGKTYRTGQNPSPEAPLWEFEVHSFRKEMDLENGRWRMEQVRTGHFLTGNPVIEQPLVQASDGSLAFDVQPDGSGRRLTAQVGRERQADLYHHPLALVRALLSGPAVATAGNLREEDGRRVLDVEITGGPLLTLHVDANDLPARIESMGYDSNYGDVRIATSLGDYAAADGLMLPGTISQTLHRYTHGDFVASHSVNAALSTDLAAPQAVASAPEPVPPPLTITTEELAPGVWYLGPGYNSVLIEFPTYAVLVEAAQNDQRALAVIERSRELIPDKPLRYLINTHFHIDHSGGVRAAVAEGLTLVTHESHEAYFREMVARPHTIHQDHLARNPSPLQIETVRGDGPFELTEGDRTLVIHRLVDDAHSDGMLMVWLPQERILVEADAFTPAARASPFAPNLLRQIRALGLDVERIAAVHGRVATLAELESTVEAVEAEGSPWGFPRGGGD